MLIIGGSTNGNSEQPPLATAEMYDPTTNQWSSADRMATSRRHFTATLLANGTVLVAGGTTGGYKTTVQLATTELYDPATSRWFAAAPLNAPRARHSAFRLADGRVLLIGGAASPTVAAATEIYGEVDPPEVCFGQTGQCARGRFLAYWQEHGGLTLNGYPLTGERYEQLGDGQFYLVQYFERTRLEYHPENKAPYDILLGQFGRQIHPADPPASPLPGAIYFPQTEHNLGGDFAAYWQAGDGLTHFGYPISEVFRETLEDGKSYEVQYFERARFERHPENPAPNTILLGQFGRRILAEVVAAPVVIRGFGAVYFATPDVRARLGAPTANELASGGDALRLERGLLIGRTEARTVLVLAFDQGGNAGKWFAYPDTWTPDQPELGGLAAPAGLFLPHRALGKVWREQAGLQHALGYALTDSATPVPLVTQSFAGGQMLWFDDGNIYVLYTDGSYQRFVDRFGR